MVVVVEGALVDAVEEIVICEERGGRGRDGVSEGGQRVLYAEVFRSFEGAEGRVVRRRPAALVHVECLL